MQPLTGIRVLDFSTLLPGPLATLLLAEAGAEVIKIERPDGGDEMRAYEPKLGADSVNFALLNRGKRSVAIDLKASDALARLAPLIETTDVIVEQFRPGVMERLGLGYEALAAINPRIIYCAITGYGQTGPKAQVAAHDVNFVSDTGMLSLTAGADGAPVLPPALIADVAGGTYPAVMNILLALRARDATGCGCKLDIAMVENTFTLLYWALANGWSAGVWPRTGQELVTGGSPRYSIYRTADARYLAAAPIEDRFWTRFCALLDIEPRLRDDARDPAATRSAVADRVGRKTAAELRTLFDGEDVCCSIVCTVEEAVRDPHFAMRGVFDRKLIVGGKAINALPLPVAERFRSEETDRPSPALGEARHLLKQCQSTKE